MDKKKQAIDFHHMGYNCAQSVVIPFCDDFGIDKETAFKLSEAFGFGMGTYGTCGTVSAMAIVLGMKNSNGNLGEGERSKGQTYKLIKEATERFLEKNSSIICKDIKGMETGKILRSCDGCIEDAIDILEEMLAEL